MLKQRTSTVVAGQQQPRSRKNGREQHMDSVSRPYPISLAAHQGAAVDGADYAAEAAAIRPSFASVRGTVYAYGFSLMLRAALFLRSCNY
jgi:hypothetical protein